MLAFFKSTVWAYPALEVVHITGVALLLGNLVLLELRVFGLGLTIPVHALARLSLGLAAGGFGLAATSGLLIFTSQPQELLANQAFTVKMLLLFTAGCNAGLFHARDSLTRLDRSAKLYMLISTALWLGVATCGRWIAYV